MSQQNTMASSDSLDVLEFTPLSRVKRYALIGLGSFFVALGTIGAFVPGLPTTVFLLLAGACYVRSSERLYRWLLTHPLVGEHFHNLRAGRGLSLRVKLSIMVITWVMIGATVIFVFQSFGLRLLLVSLAAIQGLVFMRIPTLKEDA